jgi:hypothetical protein
MKLSKCKVLYKHLERPQRVCISIDVCVWDRYCIWRRTGPFRPTLEATLPCPLPGYQILQDSTYSCTAGMSVWHWPHIQWTDQHPYGTLYRVQIVQGDSWRHWNGHHQTRKQPCCSSRSKQDFRLPSGSTLPEFYPRSVCLGASEWI